MHLAKQVVVYQSDAEGHVVIRLAKAPILVADGLPHPGPFFVLTPKDACRVAWNAIIGAIRALLHDLDPTPEAMRPLGLQDENVRIMCRNLFDKERLHYNPRMPMVAQRWRVAEELRRDMAHCSEHMKAGFERMIGQLEGGSEVTALPEVKP